jgi:hypothetical protein
MQAVWESTPGAIDFLARVRNTCLAFSLFAGEYDCRSPNDRQRYAAECITGTYHYEGDMATLKKIIARGGVLQSQLPMLERVARMRASSGDLAWGREGMKLLLAQEYPGGGGATAKASGKKKGKKGRKAAAAAAPMATPAPAPAPAAARPAAPSAGGCTVCGEPAKSECSRCKAAGREPPRYCGKGCQVAHWKTGGHKQVCKKVE